MCAFISSSVFLLGLPLMNHRSDECIKDPVLAPKHVLYQEGFKLFKEMAYSMDRGEEVKVKLAVFFHFIKEQDTQRKMGKGT